MRVETIDLEAMRELLKTHEGAFAELTSLLLAENQKMNLTRIEDPELIPWRHYLDSLTAIEAAGRLGTEDKPLSVIDLGSGAGFPVLPLAIVRPGWRFISIEATWKKCRFQETAASWLGLKNVQVVHGRAEEAGREAEFRERFDLVTARAVASLGMLAELALPLARPGGMLLAWKGPSAARELETAQGAIDTLGGKVTALLQYSLGRVQNSPAKIPDGDFYLIAVRKERPTPAGYPRSYGQIKAKPL